MNTKRQYASFVFIICFAIVSLFMASCGPGQFLGPTLTPTPTNTATPTVTPTPKPTLTPTATLTPTPVNTPTVGDTVIGQHWKVTVKNVETGLEFDTFRQSDPGFHLIILTVEVTYLGPQNRFSYAPEAVVMTHIGPSETGWTNRVILYKGESGSGVIDLRNTSIFNYLDKDQTRTETFVFAFPKTFHKFRFYFPETESIAISVE